jgi:hypothetical protein
MEMQPMVRRFSVLLLALTLVSGCATQTKNIEQPPTGQSTLTDTQVERYLHAYLPVQTMASAYWGKRRFTPPNKMLPPQGTFERAIAEMRAAGTLPDFENLLQSHGFGSFEAWKQTGQRISFAYMTLRMESRDPAGLILKRQARSEQLSMISERRAMLRTQQDNASRRQLESLEMMQKEVDREILADVDAEVLRPYRAQFDEMNKQAIRRER